MKTKFPVKAADAGDEVAKAVARLQREGKLPAKLTPQTVEAMKKSLGRYFDKISSDRIDGFADRAREIVEQSMKTEQEARPLAETTTTVGTSTAEARGLLEAFIEDETGGLSSAMDTDFFMRIAREVAEGAGQHLARNLDPTRVDEYPALELVRVYEREIPRGERRGKGGAIVDDEENGWPARWEKGCEDAGDEEAARVFKETGRMVALKSSGVWQALGDGAGGYQDTLGNPFPPFAFNSGMDVEEVSRADAEDLGLLEEGEEAEGADVDAGDLVALPAEARLYLASVAHRALYARLLADLATAALECGGSDASYGCLMAWAPDKLAAATVAWAEENVPESALTGDGIEHEPHVTIFYGFDSGFDVKRLASWLRGQNTPELKLGLVTRFECDEYDVLKVDIDSPSAERLHAAIAEEFSGDVTPSKWDYHPHLTLAYVKKGECRDLDGADVFEGTVFNGSTLVYSLPEGAGRTILRQNR